MEKPGTESGEQKTELHRVMGPGLLLLFIIGDILGTGIYALTGQVAAQVGGVVWLPFLIAFLVALLTAFSYLEWSPNIRVQPAPHFIPTRPSESISSHSWWPSR